MNPDAVTINPPKHCKQRQAALKQRQAALLALLWSLYVLLGGAGGLAPVPSASGQAQINAQAAPGRACACRMCPMHPGKACCCHPAPTSGLRAVCTARCDLGASAVLAAAHSWPALAPPAAAGVLCPPALARPARAGTPFVLSACPRPPTPPPCLS